MAWHVDAVSALCTPVLTSEKTTWLILSWMAGVIFDHRWAKDCMWAGGGTVGGMGEVGRCPRKRPGPEPETARRDRAPTGEVVAESRPVGGSEEPCPAGAEAARRIAEGELLVVDPESDPVVCLRGARG